MLGALSSHIPFVSAPDGTGLDKVREYIHENQTDYECPM